MHPHRRSQRRDGPSPLALLAGAAIAVVLLAALALLYGAY